MVVMDIDSSERRGLNVSEKECFTYLNTGLSQSYPHRNLLSHKYVGIMRLGETPLQFIQLSWSKPGPVPFLFGWFLPIIRTAVTQRTTNSTPQITIANPR